MNIEINYCRLTDREKNSYCYFFTEISLSPSDKNNLHQDIAKSILS